MSNSSAIDVQSGGACTYAADISSGYPESVARSQLDGDFSTANSLAGKSREAVADGVAEHTIQGGARQAIRRSFRV
jgi:hypothetical protein